VKNSSDFKAEEADSIFEWWPFMVNVMLWIFQVLGLSFNVVIDANATLHASRLIYINLGRQLTGNQL
jgi:hypothetical protein